MFWLSYESFSILYDVFFLPKRVISSYNRFAQLTLVNDDMCPFNEGFDFKFSLSFLQLPSYPSVIQFSLLLLKNKTKKDRASFVEFKICACDALRNLVSFVVFKKHEKHPRRSDNFSKVAILVKLQGSACNVTKINTPPWVFFLFFKLYKWY